MEMDVLKERKGILNNIKNGISVNRKAYEEKYNYWLEQQNLWIERDKQQSTVMTSAKIFECGCRHCTYRMALELLDKQAEENTVRIIQEQDEIGQYRFEF